MGEAMIDWAARETRMRRGEVYHSLRVPDDCYIVVRVDGRSFHTYSRQAVLATRRRLARCEDLPRGEEFRAFCHELLRDAQPVHPEYHSLE